MTDDVVWKNSTSSPEPTPTGFDLRLALRFSQKSVSEDTRRAYQRVVREFFSFTGNINPAEVTPELVIGFRDQQLIKRKRPVTVAFKLAVIRSFFEYLRAAGMVRLNPASTRLVPAPQVDQGGAGRALTASEVSHLLAGPDRNTADGARDYAVMLVMLRTSLRVSEVCSLKESSVKWSHGRWVITFKVKGGRERTLPLPADVKKTIDEYLKLDEQRRKRLLSDGPESHLFQPHTNYRTLVFDKPLSPRTVWNIVSRWADYGGVGKLSPHDLRRTAITRALDQGLTYRQVQMMSGHKDPKTVMRYDHGRENLNLNAVNFLKYDEETIP
jgi:site-specific recombinase XerD